MADIPVAGYAQGVPCWIDALLPDVEAGKRFYGALFGWTFEAFETGETPGATAPARTPARAYSEGRAVAALAPKRDGRMPTVWNVYFATPDAYALARTVRDAGGQVVTAPVPVGAYGTVALVTDPEGAVFGLWQAGTYPGFEKSGEPDSFCWTEVYSRDGGVVDPFYESVFGYGGTDMPEIDGTAYRLWSPAGTPPGPETAIGGRSLVSGAFPAEMPAHFLVYFNVADCDAAAARTRALGGRVRAEPFDIPYGRMAVLVDNQGAGFAVLQDPEPPS
ncbi:VOC family protein [Streptomyces boluensis]|uniref:VOC family protein n=1 Tax=Streptomyces boluensis TaxID=1775135 RepID=A0A964UWL6_9ACTN|nr:VOC family protein [Streptomyces boluensis]NBE56793.1 VOC family protein [Streptomyces boluensis]